MFFSCCCHLFLFFPFIMCLWWSLCTLHLHACQLRVTVGDSGLCCVFWVLINSLMCWFCLFVSCCWFVCVCVCVWERERERERERECVLDVEKSRMFTSRDILEEYRQACMWPVTVIVWRISINHFCYVIDVISKHEWLEVPLHPSPPLTSHGNLAYRWRL